MQYLTCSVLSLKKKICFFLLFYTSPTVTSLMYLDRFEEFHMPVLEVPWCHTVPTGWSTSTFPWRSDRILNLQVSGEMDWCGGPVTWPPNFPDLTSLGCFGGASRMLSAYHHRLSLATTFQQDENCSGTVTLNLLKNKWTETEYRYIFWATLSALIERS